MFQYRQVLVRLRAGDTVREIARSGLIGRDKAGELRALAEQHGWLDAGVEVPGDEAIIAALGRGRRESAPGARVWRERAMPERRRVCGLPLRLHGAAPAPVPTRAPLRSAAPSSKTPASRRTAASRAPPATSPIGRSPAGGP